MRKGFVPLMALITCLAGPALAEGPAHAQREGDRHERARQEMEAGRIVPLNTLLERIRKERPGEFVGARLEQDDDDEAGGETYEVRWITPDGRLLELIYDAHDGTLLRTEGENRPERDGERPEPGRRH